MSKARCNYHHGDLRNALIVAAAELIERDDTLDFTMAEAAERAGVSAAAPYRHFADKEELLRGVRELAILGLGHAAGETVLEYPHVFHALASSISFLSSASCPSFLFCPAFF